VLGERLRVELVRRHVGEIARAVRPLRDECSSSRGVAKLNSVEMTEDDALEHPGCAVVPRLPAAGGIAAEDGPFDECASLVPERQGQRVVEQPAEGATDVGERAGGCGARGAERVEVDAVAVADADRDDAWGLELAVEVEHERLARIAPQLAARKQAGQPAVELLVDDPATFAAEPVGRLRDRDGERVGLRLARQADLDRDPHGGGDATRAGSDLGAGWRPSNVDSRLNPESIIEPKE